MADAAQEREVRNYFYTLTGPEINPDSRIPRQFVARSTGRGRRCPCPWGDPDQFNRELREDAEHVYAWLMRTGFRPGPWAREHAGAGPMIPFDMAYLGNFMERINELCNATCPGTAAYYYAGHGMEDGRWCIRDGPNVHDPINGLVPEDLVHTYRETNQTHSLLIISDSCYSARWLNIVRENRDLALAVIAAGEGVIYGRRLVPALSDGDAEAFTYSLQTENYRNRVGFLSDRIPVAE